LKITIGPPKLTRYERARIIGARALQLSMGAPILVSMPEPVKDLIDIALFELKEGVLPITIRRSLPDETYQDIPLSWFLEKPSEGPFFWLSLIPSQRVWA
jgi:DNA-directed RNA polymerase I, II, and III subunit RPABC2